MTQPNQSELVESILSILGIVDRTSGNRPEQIATLEQELNAYITANYTPNTKLKALIEASVKLNLEFHGRPDCKNCSLQEQLAELIKAKERAWP